MTCQECNGLGFVPFPRGMSPGFYKFMAPGCKRRDDGTLLMLCSCRQPKQIAGHDYAQDVTVPEDEIGENSRGECI